MVDIFEMDYDRMEEMDESELSYYDDAIASGDPDEIQAMLEYFGIDCY